MKKPASSITLNLYREVQDLARSDTLSLSKYYFYALTKPLVLGKHMQRENNKDIPGFKKLLVSYLGLTTLSLGIDLKAFLR